MESRYLPQQVEQAAQKHWERNKSFSVKEDRRREKFYCLSMFPYPSGHLHMGHVRNYTIGDVIARYQRMQGKNVLQPMGWDAFGLPAENAAMNNNVPPAKWTYDNIAYMKRQLKSLGFAIDWERELATCRPEYYRWNQWLFIRMLEKGLVYKTTGSVNWDPVDQTVLANEQVIDGRGWRTGALVEKREIPMYYMKITAYTQELLDSLADLPGWPQRVKAMQANWIGRSEGVNFGFPYELDGKRQLLKVFTTRADTIMGVTFCAVAAEHPLASYAAERNAKVAAFVEACKRGSVMEADLATIEKQGLPTGLYVTHPLTGEEIEIWVGNYVLMTYGEGAVMGVPAHDERDFAFARKYGLPIKPVIDIDGKVYSTDAWQPWYEDYGRCVNSGKYDGLDYEQAVDAIAADLKAMGVGDKQVNWRLRDWGISRQRYWGCPIPIIHCQACGDVPVPDEQLPVVLPEDLVPDGSGNPLAKTPSFYECLCPRCGAPARRETDTMDTFVDSSWYYLRYACRDQDAAMVDERVDYWLPVDQYIGGIEHAILHLLYSRFWTKVMRDLALVKMDEPFTNLLTQGMVLNEVYFRKDDDGRISYYNPAEVDVQADERGQRTAAVLRNDGKPVEFGGMGTMSKSKNNGVDPEALVQQYGADTARLFMMFASPPEQSLEWSDAAVAGQFRFLRRLWDFGSRCVESFVWAPGANAGAPRSDARDLGPRQQQLRRQIHEILRQASQDIEKYQLNTVVSAAMQLLNVLRDALPESAVTAQGDHTEETGAAQALIREGLGILLRVLSPVAPHISHVMWQELGFPGDIIDAPWPVIDERALMQERVQIVVQVNGKLRARVSVPADADNEAVQEIALADENVARHVGGHAVKKVVVIPRRLVNIVV